jgi:hypothetical protein
MDKKIKRTLELIKTKVYTKQKLSKTDIVFAKLYIKDSINDKIILAKKSSQKLKFKRTWNIRTYSALNDFVITLEQESFLKELDEYERIIFLLRAIFKLEQSLSKDKDTNRFDYLMEDVSEYYRNCFITEKTSKKVLFKSNNREIIVYFKDNLIVLKDKKNKKEYKRDIILDELNIFPNRMIAKQYIN